MYQISINSIAPNFQTRVRKDLMNLVWILSRIVIKYDLV